MLISEHFTNVQMRQQTPYTIYPDGRSTRHTAHGEILDSEFEKLYPIGIITKENTKGKNSDRTKGWLIDEQSY